ncbi:MAG: hypothetical protein WC679_02610 [Bacteroidales bacterium]|jgi:hypothetical protein
MKTSIYKGCRGWTAESSIEQGEIVLQFVTMKRCSGELATTVQVLDVEGTYKVFNYGNFSKTLIAEKVSRVNEKSVTNQHEQITKASLDELFLEIQTFNAKKLVSKF